MHTRFADALIARKKAGFIPVIPDIKCTSPKEGDLLRGRDPLAVAQLLARAGAPALSVVTEPKDFGGSLDLLRQLAERRQVILFSWSKPPPCRSCARISSPAGRICE